MERLNQFRDRGALLRQIALEAKIAAVRDFYLALLAEWQAKELSTERKEADASEIWNSISARLSANLRPPTGCQFHFLHYAEASSLLSAENLPKFYREARVNINNVDEAFFLLIFNSFDLPLGRSSLWGAKP
jgi:hypothetical protein